MQVQDKIISHVWITTSFEAWHRWPDAPKELGYLKQHHRHIFHVKLMKEVTHDNRDIEFHTLKHSVMDRISSHYKYAYTSKSCEQMAKELLEYFNASMVEVSEDGENGATVIREQCIVEKEPPMANEVALDVAAPAKASPRTKCTFGICVEGPERYSRMICIPGSCTTDRLPQVLDIVNHRDIEFIQYGDSEDGEITEATLYYLVRYVQTQFLNGVDITLNVVFDSKQKYLRYLPFLVFHNIQCTLTWDGVGRQDVPEHGKDVTSLCLLDYKNQKVEIVVLKTGTTYSNKMDDPLYNCDSELE
jgi:hypothetical protein